MTGYVRKDTTNNIADGNVINAADLDAEFDGVQDAFNASTGHKHDGTAGEGATINALGPTQDVTISSTLLAPKTTNTVDIGSSSLKFKDLFLAGNASVGGTLAVTGVATLTAQPILSSLTASRAVFTDGSKGLVSNAITGTGNVVMSASPTLTGTAGFENITASGTLGVTGVATFTAQPIVSSLTASRAVFSDGSKGLVSNAITGTGNVVMSASPTLTGTIAAEALTASSSVTLSGGTANGVAYLNGSKVLTSGSALTFDGTRLAVGGGTNGSVFTARAAGAMAGFDTGTTNDGRIEYAYNGTNIFYTGIDSTSLMTLMARSGVSLAFGANGSEQMRLTSTGLGIGTSSPAYKLHVYGTSGILRPTAQGTTNQVDWHVSNTGGDLYFGIDDSAGTTSGTAYANYIYGSATKPLLFFTSGTERMRLDSAGNLGIGTSSPAYKLQVVGGNATGFLLDNGGQQYTQLLLQRNGTANTGGDILIDGTAGTFNIRSLLAGPMEFYTSATAGSPVSRMRLDTSGNLGLGVTPTQAYSYSRAFQIGNGGLIEARTSDYTTFSLATNAYLSSAGDWTYRSNARANLFTLSNGTYAWNQASAGTGTISFTQAMTLTSDGNLLVGTTSVTTGISGTETTLCLKGNSASKAASFVAVNAAGTGTSVFGTGDSTVACYAGTVTNHPFVFQTNNTERARIDSSGNLLIGTTTVKDVLTVSNGIAMVGGGSGNTLQYSGTDTRTWASSYVASSGTQTLCTISSPNGSYSGGGLVRVTTSYQYRGGNPGNNYAQYMVTTNSTATANLVNSVGTYPTITVTTVGSGSTATLDVIVNYSGDSHVQVVVEVFGKVVSWSI